MFSWSLEHLSRLLLRSFAIIGISEQRLRLSYAWHSFKFMAHFLTRECEVRRICTVEEHSKDMTIRLENSFTASTKLNSILRKSIYADETVEIDRLLGQVVAMKNIQVDRNFSMNFRACLMQISHMNSLITDLRRFRVPYDANSTDHEQMLERLWTSLRPGIRRSGRITSEWGEIGFQGHDPATDFRGMGTLGLLNLVYFAETHPQTAKAILQFTNEPGTSRYSYAITGINVTAWAVSFTEARVLRDYYYANGARLKQFHDVYCFLFVAFYEEWKTKNPPDVMSFGIIEKEFLTKMHNFFASHPRTLSIPSSS